MMRGCRFAEANLAIIFRNRARTGKKPYLCSLENVSENSIRHTFVKTVELLAPARDLDFNPEHLVYSREEKDARWEYVVKMTLIFRDMMIGNPKLAEMGFKEESMGHNAIAAGFQGQRQWTDYKPDGDFSEAILNTSFDWNGIREAFTFATENDTLNCTSMLFNHLLTNTAQIFADVRTYWSPNAIERVTGKKLEGKAANGFIHLINSGSCTLDGTG